MRIPTLRLAAGALSLCAAVAVAQTEVAPPPVSPGEAAPIERAAPPTPPAQQPYPSPVQPPYAVAAPPSFSPFEPPGVAQAFAGLTSQPAAHTAFTFDRDMLQSMLGQAAVGLSAVTVQNFRYQQPAFYVPEALAALRASYNAAGWKHLVEASAGPREQATPAKPITDLWLHFHGAEIDDVAILIRAPRQMNLIEVSGMLRPLDLIHLGGHFGIPKVDPGAVMVPAPGGQ